MSKKPIFLKTYVDPLPIKDFYETLGNEPLTKISTKMIEECDSTVAQITNMNKANDDMAKLAHQLMGICGSFGAIMLGSALAEIEHSIRDEKNDKALKIAKSLDPLWRQTKKTLVETLLSLGIKINQ